MYSKLDKSYWKIELYSITHIFLNRIRFYFFIIHDCYYNVFNDVIQTILEICFTLWVELNRLGEMALHGTKWIHKKIQ